MISQPTLSFYRCFVMATATWYLLVRHWHCDGTRCSDIGLRFLFLKMPRHPSGSNHTLRSQLRWCRVAATVCL